MLQPLEQKELESLNTPHVSPPTPDPLPSPSLNPSSFEPQTPHFGGDSGNGSNSGINTLSGNIGQDAEALLHDNNDVNRDQDEDENVALPSSPFPDEPPIPEQPPSQPQVQPPPPPPPPPPQQKKKILTPETAVKKKRHHFPHIVGTLKAKPSVLIGRSTKDEQKKASRRMPSPVENVSKGNNRVRNSKTLPADTESSLDSTSGRPPRARTPPSPIFHTDLKRHRPPSPTFTPNVKRHRPQPQERSSFTFSRSPSPVFKTSSNIFANELDRRELKAKVAAAAKRKEEEKINKLAAAVKRRTIGKSKYDCPICAASFKAKTDQYQHVVSFHSDSDFAQNYIYERFQNGKMKKDVASKIKKSVPPNGKDVASKIKKPVPPKKVTLHNKIAQKKAGKDDKARSKAGGQPRGQPRVNARAKTGGKRSKRSKGGEDEDVNDEKDGGKVAGVDYSKNKIMTTENARGRGGRGERGGREGRGGHVSGTTLKTSIVLDEDVASKILDKTSNSTRGPGRGARGRGGRGRGGRGRGRPSSTAAKSSSSSSSRKRRAEDPPYSKKPKFDSDLDDVTETESEIDDRKKDDDYKAWKHSKNGKNN